MKLRIILLFFATLLLASATSGQIQKLINQTQKDFRLEGRIIDTQFEEKKYDIRVNLTIQFDLTNVGEKNLLFWKQDKPLPLGYALSPGLSFEAQNLIDSSFLGPSFDFSEEWKNLRESLDKENPPPALIRVLEPNETWSFVSEETIITAKEAGLIRPLTLEKLRNSSPCWIKVFFQVWSRNIELDSKDRAKLPFSKVLQNRWSEYGNLWIEDIASEPIQIDLSSAEEKRRLCTKIKSKKNENTRKRQ